MNELTFEWDEAKRLSNLEKHGIDFVDAELVLDGRLSFTREVVRESEARYTTTSRVNDKELTVVWTRRHDRIRIISARKASDEERREYRQLLL